MSDDQQLPMELTAKERLEQQAAFVAAPPPCGESVIFQISRAEHGQVGALFWFDARDVQSKADEMIEANPRMVGLRGAAKWTSLRDPNIKSPTPVPAILVTFNEIAFKLVESGKGRVKCPLCDQTYETKVLEKGYRRAGGYFFKTYSCPAQHELINILEMHLLLHREP
jgi:hypothetical protein